MQPYERFGIGFIAALLYPVLKCAQNEVVLGSFAAFVGATVPFALIGLLVGCYAALVEKAEDDRGKLFRVCMSLPAFVLGLATSPITMEARAESKEIACKPISDFQRGWYDVVSAITNVKRPRYYLITLDAESEEYVTLDKRKYYILAKLDVEPTGGLVFDVDDCKIISSN